MVRYGTNATSSSRKVEEEEFDAFEKTQELICEQSIEIYRNFRTSRVRGYVLPELENCGRGESDWPKSCSWSCWWCTEPFSTIPIPCPYDYDSMRRHYKVTGVFCSFNCCKAYYLDMHVKRYPRLESLVTSMAKEIFKLPSTAFPIYAAPPRQSLKKFGGFMTIEEFRAESKIAINVIERPNVFTYRMLVETIENLKQYHERLHKHRIEVANEPLLKEQKKCMILGFALLL